MFVLKFSKTFFSLKKKYTILFSKHLTNYSLFKIQTIKYILKNKIYDTFKKTFHTFLYEYLILRKQVFIYIYILKYREEWLCSYLYLGKKWSRSFLIKIGVAA
jgi:hypothetical protein